jgi:hypothetical protein
MRLGAGFSLSTNSTSAIVSEVNHSILFDGSNDEIDFTTSAFQTALADGNFKLTGSVSIWARVNTTGSNGQMWDFAIDSNNRIQLQYKHNDDSFTGTYRAGGVNKIANYAPSGTQEGDGNFHHIVVTWDRASENELKLYYDGSLRTTTTLTATLTGDFDDTADGTLGQDGAGGVEFLAGTSFNGNADYNGYLDDFAVYSDVLTASNVTTLYNSGTSNPNNVKSVGTIIAHWKFNEGTGTTVTDSRQGYVGTFGSGSNAPTFSTINAAGE